MALSEHEQRDLLGWISNLGDDSSNVRAEQLLQDSDESMEFVRELGAIKAVFQPPYDESLMTELPESEVTAITKKILARADRIRDPHHLEQLHRTRRFIAIAACVAVLILPGFWIFSTVRKPVLGNAVFINTGSRLQAFDIREQRNVVQGSSIQTRNQLAVISLQNGQRLTLDVKTTLQIDRGDRFQLQEGAILAETVDSIEVKLSGAVLRLDGAKAIIETMSDGFSCDVSRGQADIHVNNQNYVLHPGDLGVWNQSDRKLSIVHRGHPRPSRMYAATQPHR